MDPGGCDGWSEWLLRQGWQGSRFTAAAVNNETLEQLAGAGRLQGLGAGEMQPAGWRNLGWQWVHRCWAAGGLPGLALGGCSQLHEPVHGNARPLAVPEAGLDHILLLRSGARTSWAAGGMPGLVLGGCS